MMIKGHKGFVPYFGGKNATFESGIPRNAVVTPTGAEAVLRSVTSIIVTSIEDVLVDIGFEGGSKAIFESGN